MCIFAANFILLPHCLKFYTIYSSYYVTADASAGSRLGHAFCITLPNDGAKVAQTFVLCKFFLAKNASYLHK